MNKEEKFKVNMEEKIKIVRELESDQAKLSRELGKINVYIKAQKENCSHIVVDLGHYGLCPETYYKYRCLLCGKRKSEKFFWNLKM